MQTWRHWTALDGSAGLITVTTYQTPLGQPMEPRYSRAVRIQHVTHNDAIRMLGTGATD